LPSNTSFGELIGNMFYQGATVARNEHAPISKPGAAEYSGTIL